MIPEAIPYPAFVPSSNTRLFRRDPFIYFDHCVHETVADRTDALHRHRGKAEFVIHHFGYVEDSKVRRSEKERHYYELALRKAATSPSSYEAVLGAGVAELDHAKQAATALPYFKEAIALRPQHAWGWVYTGICLTRLGRHVEAFETIHHAITLDPANLLAASTLGDICLQMADYSNARIAYERSIQLGDASTLSLAKLRAAEVNAGESDSGMARFDAAIRQCPDCAELVDIYATTAFLAGRSGDACEAAERRLAMKSLSPFNFFLAATLHLQANRNEKVQTILDDALRRFPEDASLRNLADSLALNVS